MPAATVALMQDQMPVVSVAARPHSRATARPVTLATGSAVVLSRQSLRLPAKAAVHEASMAHPVRDADNLQPGVKAKALKALDPAVSSRRGRKLRGSLLPQRPTTSGDPACAPMRPSNHLHPHLMLAHHPRQPLSLLLLPAGPV